ncbi:MAG TPA: hypothetical protein VGM39_17635, partial [Kofleriaceae bacterium]
MKRRDVLRRLAYAAAALPLSKVLMACSSSGTSVDAPMSDAAISAGWATGGTAAMTDKASYPDPFTTASSSCVLVETTTEGPCTTPTYATRQDVSEAWNGLPVRLALK